MISLDKIHPLLIHFPIALFGLAVVFDWLALWRKDDRFEFASFWTLGFAVAAVVPVVITGFIADQMEGHMAEPWRILETHGSMQIVSSLLFIVQLAWRIRNRGLIPADRTGRILYVLLGILALAGLYYGSHLGARLSGRI
ncbi:MAG: DUF2231 domain-containing protein [Fidelibacterota bacterium]